MTNRCRANFARELHGHEADTVPAIGWAGLKRGDTLYVFWSRVGDTPEHILLTTVDISGDWSTWTASDPVDVLYPLEPWEGADRPMVPSVRNAINVRVNQLRDPAIFQQEGRTYLLYSVAGEAGIAIAEIEIH